MHPDPAEGVLWYLVFVGSTVCHEAAHAWTAQRLGDDTAARGGQVSLNPWPHVRREPFGMVVFPIISWLAGGWLFGWASAPYNPVWAQRCPRRAAWMALAGPGANLALAFAAALFIRLGVEWHVFAAPYSLGMGRMAVAVEAGSFDFIAHLLSVIFSLNLLLCVFNLLPIPPLDGSSLPLLALPEAAARRYADAVRSPVLRMIGLIIVLRGLGNFFPPVLRAAAMVIHPGTHYQ